MKSLNHADIDIDAAKLLGFDYSSKNLVLPVKHEGQYLWVAMADTLNTALLTDLFDITGMFIVPVMAHAEDIRYNINKMLAGEEATTLASQFLVDKQLSKVVGEHRPEFLAEVSSAPAVRLLDSTLEASILNRASDIHIEPVGNRLRIRRRIDGHLSTYNHVDISLLGSVMSRLKIMGGMDISEKRRPQDGRFTMNFQGFKVEFRLSCLPTALGEKAVIRLLYDHGIQLKKTDLGFFPDDLERLTELFHRPHGSIFMTGPTGSGKSTTLTCFMEELNRDSVNIVTVEDPVENPIPGVNHVNVERAAGFSFASALKHILRQDPDIIMIGEIRDEETARIAIQAAATGHVMLSTLHTNDAAGVIERLLDMGIEAYLSSAALNGVISQRLVRRICKGCIRPAKLSALQAKLLDLSPSAQVFEGEGCESCVGTGYKGRVAVYEYIIMDDEMRRRLSAAPYEFAAELRERSTFKSNAVRHMLAGSTTADEILKILGKGGVKFVD